MDIFDKHYESIWKALIRPPRQLYKRRQLGPSDFFINQHPCKRYDISMVNSRKKNVQCSLYKLKERTHQVPTVIYLHGNSSSRLTSISYANQLLMQFDVLTIDLCGSGRSGGQYISLGYHQKQDLKIAIKYLTEQQGVKQIFIWGRSMGAVTALLYASKYKNVSGLVLDSPFSDLQALVKEAANSYITLPDFILNVFIENVRQHIKKLMLETEGYQFDILKLRPLKDIMQINLPVYFIAGKDDKLVNHQHTVLLYQKCPSRQKKLQLIEGGHNGPRPKQLVNKIVNFILQHSAATKSHQNKSQNIDIQNQFQHLIMSSNKIISENLKYISPENAKSGRAVKLGNKTILTK